MTAEGSRVGLPPAAQDRSGRANDPTSDRAEIGAAVDRMYAMISGPKGPRDWSLQATCFHPEARQIRTWIDENGRPACRIMSLADYASDTTPFFAGNDFYEIETARRIDLFGNIAHVWSAYEARRAMDDHPPPVEIEDPVCGGRRARVKTIRGIRPVYRLDSGRCRVEDVVGAGQLLRGCGGE